MPANVTVVVRADTTEKMARNHIAQLKSGEIKPDKLTKSELVQIVKILIK